MVQFYSPASAGFHSSLRQWPSCLLPRARLVAALALRQASPAAQQGGIRLPYMMEGDFTTGPSLGRANVGGGAFWDDPEAAVNVHGTGHGIIRGGMHCQKVSERLV
jgi:hypothetical protein